MLFCSAGKPNSQSEQQEEEEFDPALNGPLRRKRHNSALKSTTVSSNSAHVTNSSSISGSSSGSGNTACTTGLLSTNTAAATVVGIDSNGVLPSDVWYLVFSFMQLEWFFLTGRLVSKEWFDLIKERGVYSPKLSYYISSLKEKKELKRCETFVHLCREGYFKQIGEFSVYSDLLIENGGLLRLLFEVSNPKEKKALKCCSKYDDDSQQHVANTSPRTNTATVENQEQETSPHEIFGLHRLCKTCEKSLNKHTSWINLLKDSNTHSYTNCFPMLNSLSLNYEFPVGRSIITSPYLSNLTSLNIGSGHVVNDDDLKEIVNTSTLSNLKKLNLYHNLITECGACEISNSPHMSNLTHLELGLNRIGIQGFFYLVNSPNLQNLTYLDVNRNELKFDSVLEINKNSNGTVSNLKTLILLKNELGPNGSTSFMRHGFFPQLTHLDISANGLGSEGIKSFASCSYLNNLTFLEAGFNNIGDEGVKYICSSPFMSNLVLLDLINNSIGSEGAKLIASSLSNLTTLDLSNFGNEHINQISNDGAFALANSCNLKKLQTLRLRRNNIGEEASKAMENSEFLTSVTTLDLHYNNVDSKRGARGSRRPSDDSACIIA